MNKYDPVTILERFISTVAYDVFQKLFPVGAEHKCLYAKAFELFGTVVRESYKYKSPFKESFDSSCEDYIKQSIQNNRLLEARRACNKFIMYQTEMKCSDRSHEGYSYIYSGRFFLDRAYILHRLNDFENCLEDFFRCLTLQKNLI